jgi:hypothetical protein
VLGHRSAITRSFCPRRCRRSSARFSSGSPGSAAIDARAAPLLFGDLHEGHSESTQSPACRNPDEDSCWRRRDRCLRSDFVRHQDLLMLVPFRGIRVLAPSAFWKWDAAFDDKETRSACTLSPRRRDG